MKTRNTTTRFMTVVLSALMVFASIGFPAFAEGESTVEAPDAPVITVSVPTQFVPTAKNGEGNRKKGVNSDNLITISWTKPAAAISTYSILIDEVEKYRNIPATTLKYSFRAPAGEHAYAVRAYSKEDPTVFADSSAQTKNVLAYLGKVSSSWHWIASMDKATTLYKNKTGKAKIKTIPKGAKGKIITTYPKRPKKWDKPKRVQVKLEDGTVGWVAYRVISASPNIETDIDYPKSVKEAWVKNKSSDTGYLVWVNGYTQRINIFKGKKGNWKLISTNRVTLGNFYQPVSTGHKRLKAKKGRVYMLDDKGRSYYFLYSRMFGGSGYFHTRSYWANGKPKNKVQYRPNTKGCIRQFTDDAKFLYSLPKYTKVVFQ